MKLLDLFCGSGGAAMGYYRAGFDVTGVDHKVKKAYPFTFIQQDALDYLDGLIAFGCDYDLIHASPPCQRYSSLTKLWDPTKHPDLIGGVRSRLVRLGVPYVIENVVGAPLIDPVVLCGTMFGLGVWRHRLFESTEPLRAPGPCVHVGSPVGVYGHSGGVGNRRGDVRSNREQWSEAMGIDWMSTRQLAEAIPPAYTEWLGSLMLGEEVDERVA